MRPAGCRISIGRPSTRIAPAVLGIGPKRAPDELRPARADEARKAEDLPAVEGEIDDVQASGDVDHALRPQAFLAAGAARRLTGGAVPRQAVARRSGVEIARENQIACCPVGDHAPSRSTVTRSAIA